MSQDEKNQEAKKPSATTGRVSLAELLSRSMEQDGLDLDDKPVERERWDDDEGSFGG